MVFLIGATENNGITSWIDDLNLKNIQEMERLIIQNLLKIKFLKKTV